MHLERKFVENENTKEKRSPKKNTQNHKDDVKWVEVR